MDSESGLVLFFSSCLLFLQFALVMAHSASHTATVGGMRSCGRGSSAVARRHRYPGLWVLCFVVHARRA